MVNEEPQANIKVELTIPPQKILGVVQQTMSKYGEIVEEAMKEVALDLNFNGTFQEKVRLVVKEEIRNSLKKAIEDAAREAVSSIYRNNHRDLNKMITNAILKLQQDEIYE